MIAFLRRWFGIDDLERELELALDAYADLKENHVKLEQQLLELERQFTGILRVKEPAKSRQAQTWSELTKTIEANEVN